MRDLRTLKADYVIVLDLKNSNGILEVDKEDPDELIWGYKRGSFCRTAIFMKRNQKRVTNRAKIKINRTINGKQVDGWS